MIEFDPSQIANLGPVGILSVVLLWFMRRLEKHLDRSAKATNLMAQAIFRLLQPAHPEEATRLSKELDRLNGGE